MIDVYQLLYKICEDERVFEPGINLVESGLMDSYSMIELFAILEEEGIELQPTRIDRQLLRSVEGIQSMIQEAANGTDLNSQKNGFDRMESM